MKRAQAEFETSGLQVIPAPTGFVHGKGGSDAFFGAMPSAGTAYAGWLASHEWLGNAFASLRRRFELGRPPRRPRGAHGAPYNPENDGLRFSRKARTPSAKSMVAPQRPKARPSAASWAARSLDCDAWISRLISP